MSARLLLRPGEPGDAVLWSVDTRGRPTPTDADEVGLSDELADRIEAWVDALDGVYDPDVDGGRSFGGAAERQALAAEGYAIAAEIREELDDDAIVSCDFSPWESAAS